MDEIRKFDYDSFDLEPRVQLKTKEAEIEVLMGQTELFAKQTIQVAIETGLKLIEIRNIFRHNKNGGFEGWWKTRFGRSKQTAYNYINLAERFNRQTVGRLNFDPSALYLLASSSVSEDTRNAAIERAESGERITRDTAKEIIEKERFYNLFITGIKNLAHDFIKIFSIFNEVYEKLGEENYFKWISYKYGISREQGKELQQGYAKYKDNYFVEDRAIEIFNTYSDILFILTGFDSVISK